MDEFITWRTRRPLRRFDPDKPTPSPAVRCHCGGMTPLACFLSGPGGVKGLRPTRENLRRSRPRTLLCFPPPSLPAEVPEWGAENQ